MREFGVVGLGRIGGGIARQALDKGLRVVGATRSGASAELLDAGLVEVRELRGFRGSLRAPRAVFVYVPAGRAVDGILEQLGEALEPGDVVLDGGNSYWGDSIRRHRPNMSEGFQVVQVVLWTIRRPAGDQQRRTVVGDRNLSERGRRVRPRIRQRLRRIGPRRALV